MKKTFTVILMGILSVCVLLTGCAKKIEMPKNLDIKNNGGSVVTVGDYTYFANGFKSLTSLKKGDNKNNETLANLSRVKMKDGKFTFDKDGKIETLETISKKLVGYENSNMYVYKNYMYFTTPNILKNIDNEIKFEYVNICKVKLDGTGFKSLFTIEQEKPNLYFTKIDGKECMVYLEGTNLKKFTFGKDKVTEIAKDIQTVVFDEEQKTIAYATKKRDDEQQGNVLCTVDLTNGKVTEIVNLLNRTYELKSLAGGRLVYTVVDSDNEKWYYSNDFVNDNNEKLLVASSEITDLIYVDTTINNTKVFAYIYQENLYVKVINDNTFTDVVVNKADEKCGTVKNILGAYEGFVYYLTDKGIFRTGYIDGNIQKIASNTDVKAETFDFDGRYIYFFSKVENKETTEEDKEETKDENYYMFVADTHYADLDEESKMITTALEKK